MRILIYKLTLVLTLVFLSNYALADKWSDQFPHIKNTGDIPGECSYESMSKKDYSGRTLRINTHAVPVMGEPTALHAHTHPILVIPKSMVGWWREGGPPNSRT